MTNLRSEFLTTPQAADFLGLKKGTLEVWRSQGRGPTFVKLGRAIRYRLKDIEDFINSQTVAANIKHGGQ